MGELEDVLAEFGVLEADVDALTGPAEDIASVKQDIAKLKDMVVAKFEGRAPTPPETPPPETPATPPPEAATA